MVSAGPGSAHEKEGPQPSEEKGRLVFTSVLMIEKALTSAGVTSELIIDAARAAGADVTPVHDRTEIPEAVAGTGEAR
ncbi:hypothetical protein SHIRM173S_13343 [Streptomyces hirsutus]